MVETLNKINFITPTPIQEQAIPVALEGKDILGSAQTGTGKTGAFAIPMINHLLNNPQSTSLVLLPTRELAQQVLEATNLMLGRSSKIYSALLIGGDSMGKQLQQLKRNPRIIIGTPGRINDHLLRRTLKLTNTDFLVLDETDRMLDMGFGIQLEQIAKFLPDERQTLMFSATLPANIVALSRKYLTNPVRIAIGSTTAVAQNVKQEMIKTNDSLKYGELMKQLTCREGSVLIFVKTKYGAERLAIKLSKENQNAEAIHGDLRQSKRERVIANFRNQKYRILVATDIAARGLDIPHIQSVINYDLPQCPEDYIHRIGRTARAGAEGTAINMLTPSDNAKWKAIYKLLNPSEKDLARMELKDCPLDTTPLNANENKKKTKAKINTQNPFKPFAPDKKAKSHGKFNKNSRTFVNFGSDAAKATSPKKNDRSRRFSRAA